MLQQKQHTQELIATIRKHRGRRNYSFKVLTSESSLDTLVEKSSEYDLLIVGTRKVKLLERAVVGRFSTQVAERASCSVAVVRKVSTTQKLIGSV